MFRWLLGIGPRPAVQAQPQAAPATKPAANPSRIPGHDASPETREAWWRAWHESRGLSYEEALEDRALLAGTASPEVAARVNSRARARLDRACRDFHPPPANWREWATMQAGLRVPSP